MSDAAPCALFRVDADGTVGLGHVSRCLAIAEALEERGWACGFAGSLGRDASILIDAAGFTRQATPTPAFGPADIDVTLATANQPNGRLLMIDSYAVTPAVLRILANGTKHLAVMDDGFDFEIPARMIVNFTGYTPRAIAPGAGRRVLRGLAYFPARRALRERRKLPPVVRTDRVVVTFGGADRFGLTLKTLQVLLSATHRQVIANIPHGHIDGPAIRALQQQYSPRLQIIATPQELPANLMKASHVICGGGMTKYECMYLGIPVGVIAQNARESVDNQPFLAKGALSVLESPETLTQDSLAAAITAFLDDEAGNMHRAAAARALFPDDPAGNIADAIDSGLRY